MSGVFGGGSSTSVSKPVLSDNQENLYEASSDIVNALTRGLRNPDGSMNVDNYKKLVADLTPDQQAAIGMVRGVAGSGDYKAGLQKAMGMTESAAGMPNISAFYSPYTNDVVNTTIADMNTQTGRQAAQLKAQQAAKGAFGSRADLATGVFLGDANRNLATTIANLRNTGFNTALGAAQKQQQVGIDAAGQYAQQVGQLQGGLLNTANALQDSGQIQQTQIQAGLDAPLTAAGRISSMASGYPTGTATTNRQPSASPFSQILGAGLAGASFFKFADGGIADGLADGGTAPVDMSVWQNVSTADMRDALQTMAADDPDRGFLEAVLATRVRQEGDAAGSPDAAERVGAAALAREIANEPPMMRPGSFQTAAPPAGPSSPRMSLGLGITGKPFGDASWGPGRTNPIPARPAVEPVAAEPQGIAAAPPEPLPQLPTDMRQFSPAEIAAGQEGTRMRAAADAARPAPAAGIGDSFLGAAPAFDILPAAAPGGDGGLSFGKPPAEKFPQLASAIDDLLGPGLGGGIPNRPDAPIGIGGGQTLRPVQVSHTPATQPAVAQNAGIDAGIDTPVAQPAANDDGGNWLDRALDNPLLYIGLSMLASQNPNALGAIGEGAIQGIGAYNDRRYRQQKLALDSAKAGQDLYFEQQKLALQQAVAEGRMTGEQARLLLAQAAAARADRVANRPSATREKFDILTGIGASPDQIINSFGGAERSVGRDERTRFIADMLKQNPGMTVPEAASQWDELEASGASDEDLFDAVPGGF